MLIYQLLITAILFVLLIICIWNLYLLRRKKYNKIPDNELPFVSVLVPARNEEQNIKNILTSLLNQDYPNYELIVLNDNSDDLTGEIINEIKSGNPGLIVLNGKPPGEGWTGKCFACKQLYEASRGEYLLFTDADTVHKNNSLRDSVTIAINSKADLLTLFPENILISFAEKLIMPMLFFTVMMLLPLYFVDKKGFTKFSIGIGPFMLFKRDAYEKIGTHESVKSALVEDVWLGRIIKEHGLKLVATDGMDMLCVRMYRSFKEIWNGFSKNIFAGFNFSTSMLFTVNVIYTLLFFLPFIFFAIELLLYFSCPHNGINYLLILTGIQVFILYLARFLLSRRFKLSYISSVLHPFGVIMVPVIAINSWVWIKLGSGAKWKGRVYKK